MTSLLKPPLVFDENLLQLKNLNIPGKITSIQTRGGEHHHQAWLTVGDTNAVVVKVKACQDAYALFTPYFGQAEVKTYEIGLGVDQNTAAVIKKDYNEVRTCVYISHNVAWKLRFGKEINYIHTPLIHCGMHLSFQRIHLKLFFRSENTGGLQFEMLRRTVRVGKVGEEHRCIEVSSCVLY